jgi:hypothetical protein
VYCGPTRHHRSLLFYVNHAQTGARPRPPPPCFVAASFDEWDALLCSRTCTRMVICRLLFPLSSQSPVPLPPRITRCTTTPFQDDEYVLHGKLLIASLCHKLHALCGESMKPASSHRLGSSLPHLHRHSAHRCNICSGTRLTAAACSPGLASSLPHLYRVGLSLKQLRRARFTAFTFAPGLGSLLPHLRRKSAHCCQLCAGTPHCCQSVPGLRSPLWHLR